jgi:hypothetical protein
MRMCIPKVPVAVTARPAPPCKIRTAYMFSRASRRRLRRPAQATRESDDAPARLYALAPGNVIPWHYRAAVTDLYFCLVGILRVETRAPPRRRAACCRRPLPDPAEDVAPHLERWRGGLRMKMVRQGGRPRSRSDGRQLARSKATYPTNAAHSPVDRQAGRISNFSGAAVAAAL